MKKRKEFIRGANIGAEIIKKGFITKAQIKDKFDYYGGLCYICGFKPASALDHYKSQVLGGSDLIANLKPVCMQCNSRKSHLQPNNLNEIPRGRAARYQKKRDG